jgi:hypothetical protein
MITAAIKSGSFGFDTFGSRDSVQGDLFVDSRTEEYAVGSRKS